MISIEGYKDWLILNGYKEKTPKNQPSTVYNYTLSIENVLKWEHIDIGNLAKNINSIIKIYDKGGIKKSVGDEKHGTVISSLKCFKIYVIVDNLPSIIKLIIKTLLYILKPFRKIIKNL